MNGSLKRGDRVLITTPAYYGMTATYWRPGGLHVATGAFFMLDATGEEMPFDPHEYSVIIPEADVPVPGPTFSGEVRPVRFDIRAGDIPGSWCIWDTRSDSQFGEPTTDRLVVLAECRRLNATSRCEIHTLVSPVDYQERAEAAELEAQAYRAKMHQQARIARRKQAWINRGVAEGWIRPPGNASKENVPTPGEALYRTAVAGMDRAVLEDLVVVSTLAKVLTALASTSDDLGHWEQCTHAAIRAWEAFRAAELICAEDLKLAREKLLKGYALKQNAKAPTTQEAK